MPKHTALVPVALLVFASGCASIPDPIAPTGEPLSVEGQKNRYTYTQKQDIGRVRTSDSRGYSHTTTVYADVKKVGTSYTWSGYQGDAKISDDSLFHIAKDDEAEKALHDYRASGVFQNRLGWLFSAAGLAAIAGGVAVYKSQGDDASKTVPSTLALAGGIVLSIGTYLVYHGLGKTKEQHPLGEARARQAAERYNQTLR